MKGFGSERLRGQTVEHNGHEVVTTVYRAKNGACRAYVQRNRFLRVWYIKVQDCWTTDENVAQAFLEQEN